MISFSLLQQQFFVFLFCSFITDQKISPNPVPILKPNDIPTAILPKAVPNETPNETPKADPTPINSPKLFFLQSLFFMFHYSFLTPIRVVSAIH